MTNAPCPPARRPIHALSSTTKRKILWKFTILRFFLGTTTDRPTSRRHPPPRRGESAFVQARIEREQSARER
jgi:hypothetical protein